MDDVHWLSDKSDPGIRVWRKTLGACLTLTVVLFLYRHLVLDMGFGVPLLGSFGLAFMLIAAIGVMGGAVSGGLYKEFYHGYLVKRNPGPLAQFALEWVFAVFAPIFAAFVLGLADRA